MNTDNKSFPPQKLPLSKKTKEWRESSLDGVISREGSDNIGRKDVMNIAYGLYNSDYNEEDLKYVTNPFRVEDGFPAKTQDFNIIRPKIDLLIGEESKRPDTFNILQTNDSVVTDLQNKKKEALYEYATNLLLGDQQSQDQQANNEKLANIDKYFKKSYKNMAEQTAYHSLNFLKEKLNLKNEFLKGWKDGLIAGEEIYYNGIVNGEAVLERVNPVMCSYDKDPDLEFIEDGDWFVRRMNMSPSTIYDRFFDSMTEADLDKLLDYSNDRSGGINTGSAVNTKTVMYRENLSSLFTDDDSPYWTLPVYHGVWRSYKKVGFLTTPEGETEMVDETYKVDPDEKIEWNWLPEIWEGYKIGDDIYIDIGPVEYQHTSIDNPVSRKLPYTGVIYSNTNSKSKSLVSIMKPLQYMYIIIWYRLELALARDKGKVITMDITQIPKGLGVDLNQWMHYLTALGVNFVNPYDEGWDIPGREGGKPASFNQISQLDLTMGAVIAEYVNLMTKIEEMIGEISGVSKQRQGSIATNELVGNVERSVIQSSHITEPLFWLHNQAKRNAYTNLLNTAKFAWNRYGTKSLHYILPDVGRIFLSIEDDFVYSDFDIFISDSTQEQRNIEKMNNLLPYAMQNGATLLDAANLISSNNLVEIKNKLEDVDTKREQMVKNQSEAEQQVAQAELQLKQDENRLKEEDSIRKSETAIQVALINADSKVAVKGMDGLGDGDVNDNGIKDELDSRKLDLQYQKQQSDAELKQQQLDEDARKNRKLEAQKQQEIEIKRKQANKPSSNTSK